MLFKITSLAIWLLPKPQQNTTKQELCTQFSWGMIFTSVQFCGMYCDIVWNVDRVHARVPKSCPRTQLHSDIGVQAHKYYLAILFVLINPTASRNETY